MNDTFILLSLRSDIIDKYIGVIILYYSNERIWSLYIHINKVNNKKYVGITKENPKRRWRRNGDGYKNQTFGRAIEKYGWENFEHKILFSNLNELEAINKEKFVIKYYSTYNPNFGYNMTFGGESYKHTEESKKKSSEAKIGLYVGENNPNYGNHALQGENHPFYGKQRNEETKEKISKSLKEYFEKDGVHPMKGKHHTLKSKQQMSESHKNIFDIKKHPKAKMVICNNKIYDCITYCANDYDINPKTMQAWLKGTNNMPKFFKEMNLSYYVEEERNN